MSEQELSQEFKEHFYALLHQRRSIRKFRKDPVPHVVMDRIIQAGVEAPSGKNRQNWRFYLLEGQKRDDYLSLSQKSWLGIKDVLEKRPEAISLSVHRTIFLYFRRRSRSYALLLVQ